MLLIEDDAPSREILKSLLEDLNYQIVKSENGHQALALAVGNRADLILTDFCLPEMNGAQLIRRLREISTSWASIPAFMMTGSDRDNYYELTNQSFSYLSDYAVPA